MSKATIPQTRQRKSNRLEKIFVGGIPRDVDEQEFVKYFSKFGTVKSVELPRHKKSRGLKGFAFICFTDKTAKTAALSFPKHYILGKCVAVREGLDYTAASNQTKQLQACKIFVQGFKRNVSENQIQTFFGQFGQVNRVLYLLHQRTGRFRGFCYVIMNDHKVYRDLLKLRSLKFQDTILSLEPAQSLKQIKKHRNSPETTLNQGLSSEYSEVQGNAQGEILKRQIERNQPFGYVKKLSLKTKESLSSKNCFSPLLTENKRIILEGRGNLNKEHPFMNFSDTDDRSIIQKITKASPKTCGESQIVFRYCLEEQVVHTGDHYYGYNNTY